MSVMGEINADIYTEMAHLQEKLKQSEAERMKLENMYSVLIKTFKEEEEIRLNNLESRYHSFLEDCARRSSRNEKILRSVERVESGANVLYAKTERLKLLRNHYEAYLERVMPEWKTPLLLGYGPRQILPSREMEWCKRNQMIEREIMEPAASNPQLDRAVSRHTNFKYPFPRIYTGYGGQALDKTPSRSRNDTNRNFWEQANREAELRHKLMSIYGEQGLPVDYRTHLSEYNSSTPYTSSRGHVGKTPFNEEVPNIGMASAADAHYRQTKQWNSGAGFFDRSAVSNEMSDSDMQMDKYYSNRLDDSFPELHIPIEALHLSNVSHGSTGESQKMNRPPTGKVMSSADNSGNFDRNHTIESPVIITREPVEIKKPEFIAGKLRVENPSGFDFINARDAEPSRQKPHLGNALASGKVTGPHMSTEVEYVSEMKRSQSKSLADWRLPNQSEDEKVVSCERQDSPYEIIANQGMASAQNLVTLPNNDYEKVQETDDTQTLSEGWISGSEHEALERSNSENNREINMGNNYELHGLGDAGNRQNETASKLETQVYEQFQEQESPLAGVYEDNEESYPESYYEQPTKTHYSNNIASNVILEEDESEVNVNDTDQGPVRENAIEMNEKRDIEGPHGPILFDNSTDHTTNQAESYAEDVQRRDDADQEQLLGANAYGTNSVYDDGSVYANEYQGVSPSIYENQDMSMYEQQNNITVQHEVANPYDQQYLSDQDANNIGADMVAQEQSYQMYSQNQNFDNNIASQEYNNAFYEGQFVQEEDKSTEKFYNQESSNEYYNDQLVHGNELSASEGNPNYAEDAGFESQQGEYTQYGDENGHLPLRQNNIAHLLESDSESFQMEHGSGMGNEDSDFDFSTSQK